MLYICITINDKLIAYEKKIKKNKKNSYACIFLPMQVITCIGFLFRILDEIINFIMSSILSTIFNFNRNFLSSIL